MLFLVHIRLNIPALRGWRPERADIFNDYQLARPCQGNRGANKATPTMRRSPGFLVRHCCIVSKGPALYLSLSPSLSLSPTLTHPPNYYHTLFIPPSCSPTHNHTQTCLASDLQAFVAELELPNVYIYKYVYIYRKPCPTYSVNTPREDILPRSKVTRGCPLKTTPSCDLKKECFPDSSQIPPFDERTVGSCGDATEEADYVWFPRKRRVGYNYAGTREGSA